MITKITKAQLEEIEATYSCEGKEAAYALLQKHAGLERLSAEGYACAVCYNAAEAIKTIESYNRRKS